MKLDYQNIEGKTYSLFGNTNSTETYYSTIKKCADIILYRNDIETVLAVINKFSSKKRYLRNLIFHPEKDSLISYCLNSIHHELKTFTKNTNDHLRHLPPFKMWDRRLSTTEEKYHLYMLEIELINRKNVNQFMRCDRKISLQPHCLRDFSVTCKASRNGFDYQCGNCSNRCYQNQASRMMNENGIDPYIWMGASTGKTVRLAKKNNTTFGVLGIACIPELVWGIRKCGKLKIPVIGIPLNANRCARWFGEFHPNSIDLQELKNLIAN